jgi:uncharacterized membrane protein
MYNWLKFLHVVSVIIWVGGMLVMILLNRRLARNTDQPFMRTFNQQTGALSMVLFGPAALVAVITGIGMVQVGQIGFFHIWIMWGIVGSLASFVVGGALTGGTARKLGREMAQGEVDPARIASVQRRIITFAMLNVLLLLSIVWVMVFKVG